MQILGSEAVGAQVGYQKTLQRKTTQQDDVIKIAEPETSK